MPLGGFGCGRPGSFTIPRLSARQVMSRLEHTAHAPAGRDDLAVGAGVVDILAAVGDEITHQTTDRQSRNPLCASPVKIHRAE